MEQLSRVTHVCAIPWGYPYLGIHPWGRLCSVWLNRSICIRAIKDAPLLLEQQPIFNTVEEETTVRKVTLLTALVLMAVMPCMSFAAEKDKKENSVKEKSTPAIKVGVLDWQMLIAKSPQAEQAGKRLEKEFKDRKDTFMDKQKQLETKNEKFQRDKDIMADAERVKAERELSKLQQDLRNLQEENQADYAVRHREEMDKFLNLVKSIVDEYAKKEHFDLILPLDTTLFAAERIDITMAILEKLKADKSS
jgi:outer membrane protein